MNHRSPNEPAQIYDAAQLAATFTEVAIDVVRGESTEFLSRWYQAARGDADLTIWWDGDKRVVKQQLCLYGQVVEWNPIFGTRTGLVVEHETATLDAEASTEVSAESESSDEHAYERSVGDEDATSEIIHFDARADRTSIEQAVDLVRHVGVLTEEDRALLIYNFLQSPKLHKNARERAIKAWAPQSEELMTDARPNFWKRLGRWVFGS